MTDDYTLLNELAGGDELAFNKLFEIYRERIYNYLFKITKSSQISEEIVIDIFVKIWVGRELMSKIENLESFLHKIAYHKAIDFLRVTSRHARLKKVYIDRLVEEPEKLADDLIIDAEYRQILQKAIQQLPPQRKLIYTLSREDGLTHNQIANALNLSKNTVKNSMMAATRSIKEFLQDNKSSGVLSIFFFLV
ncbi:MAG TPA: sigma-70 family RNA polymerase sigma factor [Hanamia sp.]|nr:sigma-70 family RNA polymerase sigma factor [Hanamia sp.]